MQEALGETPSIWIVSPAPSSIQSVLNIPLADTRSCDDIQLNTVFSHQLHLSSQERQGIVR
jgi:hypothetical protein